MKQIFLSGNFVVYVFGGTRISLQASSTTYKVNGNSLSIKDGASNSFVVDLSAISTYENELAVVYTIPSLYTFLETNCSGSGNSGGGGTNLHSGLTLDDGTNPHGTTKSDVGLSNVDNTSDLSKPISTATQIAIDNTNTAFNDFVTVDYINDLNGKLNTNQFSGLSKITVSLTAPTSPSVGDLWVDIN